jgi:hypothetical protein
MLVLRTRNRAAISRISNSSTSHNTSTSRNSGGILRISLCKIRSTSCLPSSPSGSAQVRVVGRVCDRGRVHPSGRIVPDADSGPTSGIGSVQCGRSIPHSSIFCTIGGAVNLTEVSFAPEYQFEESVVNRNVGLRVIVRTGRKSGSEDSDIFRRFTAFWTLNAG